MSEYNLLVPVLKSCHVMPESDNMGSNTSPSEKLESKESMWSAIKLRSVGVISCCRVDAHTIGLQYQLS